MNPASPSQALSPPQSGTEDTLLLRPFGKDRKALLEKEKEVVSLKEMLQTTTSKLEKVESTYEQRMEAMFQAVIAKNTDLQEIKQLLSQLHQTYTEKTTTLSDSFPQLHTLCAQAKHTIEVEKEITTTLNSINTNLLHQMSKIESSGRSIRSLEEQLDQTSAQLKDASRKSSRNEQILEEKIDMLKTKLSQVTERATSTEKKLDTTSRELERAHRDLKNKEEELERCKSGTCTQCAEFKKTMARLEVDIRQKDILLEGCFKYQ